MPAVGPEELGEAILHGVLQHDTCDVKILFVVELFSILFSICKIYYRVKNVAVGRKS